MTRTIVFDTEKAQKRFEMVRTALLNAGDGKAERNRERVRKEARLMDALDSISVPVDLNAPDGDRKFIVIDGRDSITIDQADHKLIEEYLATTPWLPRSSRAAVDAQDWWDAASKEEK